MSEIKAVRVLPEYGFGWRNRSGQLLPVPNPFTVKTVEHHMEGGEMDSGTGRVIEPDHPFDGYWASFCVRASDATGPHFNIRLLEREPVPIPKATESEIEAITMATGFGKIQSKRSLG